MGKQVVSEDAIVRLCAAFFDAVNEQSEGRMYKHWPHLRRKTDDVIGYLRTNFANGYVQGYITTQQQQDAAALRALELSGMKYDDVRSALKKQYDLPQLVTILGHAVRNGPR
jgi:hypothetical protein